ncbi:ion channel activity [Aspergillus sclerotialis]|uniref:Ion channel activity n=1 Tax=Aspergillus sclerotialis TaxID=2070753 RepID=A0A3A2Z2P0_9EURO|nr:ion channel activity [Aspergillus sclerotialis]
MGNDVFRHNGFTNTVTTNNHITAAGSDWYWTVCSVMTVSTLALMALSFFKQRSQRLLYYIAAGLTLIPAISYFCMGSNLGWTAILVEWVRSDANVHGDMRQIFYVRYIDYFITVPLLFTLLLLSCGLPTSTLLYTLLMGEVWVIMALVGALVHSEYKWGFFTFGTVALLFVASPSSMRDAPMPVLLDKISSASTPSALPGLSPCGSSTPSSGVSPRVVTSSLRTPRPSPMVSWIS